MTFAINNMMIISDKRDDFLYKLRLKKSADISGYTARLEIILNAMKKYGLILADIGSNIYISGAPDERWINDELHQLGKIKASLFEVVKFN